MTSDPTDKEMAAFIHGIMNGHAAATAGLTSAELCMMLDEVELELEIPPAEPGDHPCFARIQQSKTWRKYMPRGN